jgi:hypothetical protein
MDTLGIVLIQRLDDDGHELPRPVSVGAEPCTFGTDPGNAIVLPAAASAAGADRRLVSRRAGAVERVPVAAAGAAQLVLVNLSTSQDLQLVAAGYPEPIAVEAAPDPRRPTVRSIPAPAAVVRGNGIHLLVRQYDLDDRPPFNHPRLTSTLPTAAELDATGPAADPGIRASVVRAMRQRRAADLSNDPAKMNERLRQIRAVAVAMAEQLVTEMAEWARLNTDDGWRVRGRVPGPRAIARRLGLRDPAQAGLARRPGEALDDWGARIGAPRARNADGRAHQFDEEYELALQRRVDAHQLQDAQVRYLRDDLCAVYEDFFAPFKAFVETARREEAERQRDLGVRTATTDLPTVYPYLAALLARQRVVTMRDIEWLNETYLRAADHAPAPTDPDDVHFGR